MLRTITILAAAAMLAACGQSEGAAVPDANGQDTTGVRIVNVEAMTLEPTMFTDYIRVTGEAVALHDVTLAAEEMGQVARFRVERGARVAAGDIIAELDASVLAAQVAEARSTSELAQVQFERQRALWEEQRIGSEITFLQARTQAETARARLAMLEARFENTRIRTPVAGVFDEKFIEAGEMAVPGQPIARVVSTGRIKIEAGLPERAGLVVRAGARATVTFDVLPGERFPGRVTVVGASVDPVNRTVPVEVVLDNPAGIVKPNMVANVELVREEREAAIVVPQQSVLRTETGYQVLVVEEREGGTLVAAARPVVLGPAWGNMVVIEEGLTAGQRLIFLGQQIVDPGTRVRVVASAPGRN